MSSEESSSPESQSQPRSEGVLVGSITGSRSASGTISSLEAKGSFDGGPVLDDVDEAPVAAGRPRLYSEEDEELRMAKAMALAVQQHPNMTPDQLHEMHIGDEQQSTLIADKAQQKLASGIKGIHESIKTSQKKAKERIQSIMVSPSSNNNKTAAAEGSPAVPTRGAVVSPVNSVKAPSTTTTSATKPASPSAKPAAAAVETTKATPKQAAAEAVTKAKTAVQQKTAPAIAKAKAAVQQKTAPAVQKAKTTANEAVTKAKTTVQTVPATVQQKAAPADSSSVTFSPSFDVSEDGSTTKKDMKPSKKQAAVPEEQKIVLSGIVWKRRSGFGKLSYTKAWERRKIILQGTKLYYFVTDEGGGDEDDDGSTTTEDTKKTTWLEQAAQNWEKSWLTTSDSGDPTTPRGYLDLVKENATVAAATGHSGAPSPFAISIKVKGDTIWKLCFDTHSAQMKWLAALTDVVVTSSIDAYNANLLLAADPSHQESGVFAASGYLPPPARDGAAAPHRLWMMDPYNVSSDNLDELPMRVKAESKETKTKETAAVVEERTVSERTAEEEVQDQWILRQRQVHAIVTVVNLSLLFAQSSSTTSEGFWYILVFCNLVLWLCLVKDESHKTAKAPPTMPVIVKEPELVEVIEKEEEVIKPPAGCTAVKLENPKDSPERNGRIFGGWCAPPGEMLAVRSHGYLTTKTKIPSPGELYECVHFDVFETPHQIRDMARRVILPKVEFANDPSPKTWHSPDVFVVSVALPTDPPKMRGSSDDGGGYCITMYFAMRQETRDILKRVTADSYDPLAEPEPADIQKSKVNAVKLFEQWCRRAPTDPAFQSRFKLVANSQNLKEIGIPNWIAKYNGKPVLIKRAGQTGFLYAHPELSCMEFDISFFPFPYLAKQAICYLKENFFKKVLVTFGFVIEGRSDDELPECLIGLMQLCYPDPKWAIQAADFFAGTSPKPY